MICLEPGLAKSLFWFIDVDEIANFTNISVSVFCVASAVAVSAT